MTNKKNLNQIVKIVSTFLERRNFSKKNRTFLRKTDDGFFHLIDFGLSQNWSMYYGKFTVDLGVFLPEVYSILRDSKVPSRITTYHCEIKKRLPSLAEGIEDKWWDTHEIEKSADEVINLLIKHGFSYFDGLDTRGKLYRTWLSKGNSIGFPPRSRLILAIVMKYQGNDSIAKDLIVKEIQENRSKKGYCDLIKIIAKKINLTIYE